jgi:hypothetical protein
MRSGNHILINWILANNFGNSTFINDIDPSSEKVSMDSDGLPCFKYNHLRRVPLDKKPNTVVVSLENRPFSNCKTQYRYLDYCNSKYKYVDFNSVVIIRDYFNIMASTYKCLKADRWFVNRRNGNFIESPDPYYHMWFRYAHEFIQCANDQNAGCGINYDKFIDNQTYRNEVAVELKIKNENRGLEQVPAFGFGSSFGTDAKSGFLDRWREFKDDKDFASLVKGGMPIVGPLYKQIFGETEQYNYFKNL